MRLFNLAAVLVVPFAVCTALKADVEVEEDEVQMNEPDIMSDIANGFVGLADEIRKQLDARVVAQEEDAPVHYEEGVYKNLVSALFPSFGDAQQPTTGLLNLPSSLVSSVISSLLGSMRTWNPLKVTTKTLQQIVSTERGTHMVQDMLRGLGTLSSMLPVAAEIGQAFLTDASNMLTQAIPMISGVAKATASLLGVKRGEIHKQDMTDTLQTAFNVVNKAYPYVRPFVVMGYKMTLGLTRMILTHSPQIAEKIVNLSRSNVQDLVQAAEIMLHL
ncbi:hypothetical protein EC973_006557 [Apophysomyces ossiformis]|uniref:Uncharacterized protein n=1 Tax=Apophysomyces ossiformis TaxID=679940 RepID=A0A8H7EQE6_9FUNG|nr:hypothetical protein EC973_006557 [Apophysomyces ossiformis]